MTDLAGRTERRPSSISAHRRYPSNRKPIFWERVRVRLTQSARTSPCPQSQVWRLEPNPSARTSPPPQGACLPSVDCPTTSPHFLNCLHLPREQIPKNDPIYRIVSTLIAPFPRLSSSFQTFMAIEIQGWFFERAQPITYGSRITGILQGFCVCCRMAN